MLIVETAPHEFDANFIFNTYGLRPYFGIDSAIKQNGGAIEAGFDFEGDRWVARLYYDDSTNIVHPGDQLPTGTRFDLETIREFRLKVKKSVDDAGQKSFVSHIAPRWDGMKGERSDGTQVKIPIPEEIQEGVNIRVQGSNIPFQNYHDLLKSGFAAVGVRSHYFDDYHEHSNISDAGRYVRIDKNRSGPIHARDGTITKMAHLLESDRRGYRKLVQNDDDERNRNLPGYYHTVTLGTRRIREAFPEHDLPKEIKHYYAREAKSKKKNDPLAHPKLEASYQRSRWDNKLGIDEIEKLNRELDQAVYSVLADSGLQIHQGSNAPYIPDEYFEAENVEIDKDENPVISLDLTQIEHTQESVVIKHLKGGLSPCQQEAIGTLVTDGGQLSPKDIAEQHGRHPDSVRRALRQMNELVETAYADVQLKSPHVAELLHNAIQQAEDSINRATQTAGQALEAAERGLNGGVSALIAWGANHGIDIRDSDGEKIQIDLGQIDGDSYEDAKRKVRARLRDGRHVWTQAGRDADRYLNGDYSVRVVFDKQFRSISKTERSVWGGKIRSAFT